MELQDIGFRIKQAIGLTGLSVKDFCEKTERSRVSTAMWLSGRGGVMKESSLHELCKDLFTSGVSCSKEWILTNNGPSPSLINIEKKRISDLKINSNINISLIHENINSLIDNFSADNIFDYHCQDYYLIAKDFSLNEPLENSFSAILLKNKKQYQIGFIEKIYENNGDVIFKDLQSNLHSFRSESIIKKGKVLLYFIK